MSNLPDDWGSYYGTCSDCGGLYHDSGCVECHCKPCERTGQTYTRRGHKFSDACDGISGQCKRHTCDDCGTEDVETTEDEMAGKTYCEDCIDEYLPMCDWCGERGPPDVMTRDEGENTKCEDCHD